MSKYKSPFWTPQELRFLLYGLRNRQVTVTVNGHEQIRCLYPVEVLSVAYGFTQRALYNQIRSGRLQAVKQNGRWLIVDPMPQLNAWAFAWDSVATDRHPRDTQPNLRTHHVAIALGTSSRRIRSLAQQGRIHFTWYKPGRTRLFSISDICRFLKEREGIRHDGRVERAQKRLAQRFLPYHQKQTFKRLGRMSRREEAERSFKLSRRPTTR